MLLLCELILTEAPYHSPAEYTRASDDGDVIPWEDCSLRKELNEAWLSRIFSPEEQDRIAETACDSPEAADRLFLLSGCEFLRYAHLMTGASFRNKEEWVRCDPEDRNFSGLMARTGCIWDEPDLDWQEFREKLGVRPALWARLP